MKKTILFGTVFCLTLGTLSAQKKYEKIIYTDATQDIGEAEISAKDAVSIAAYTKFKIKIENKSDGIMLLKPEESKVVVNGKNFVPQEKWLFVNPAESDHRTVDIKGTEFMVNQYSYEVDGLYKISTDDRPVQAPDFQLPASQNEFKAGNFTCAMLDLKKETGGTAVKFECRYTGDKIGVIHTNRAAIKLPDGTEIANAKTKTDPVVLMKGESKKVSLSWDRMEGGKATDMQKIKLMIVWRNTFIEAEARKMPAVRLDIKIDETKSK